MAQAYHGRTIDIGEDLSRLNVEFPSRNDMLNADDVNHIYENYLHKKKPILFMSNDVAEQPQYYDYELILYGILPCGSKATVIIEGIYPYIDMDINQSLESHTAIANARSMLRSGNIDYQRAFIVTGKDFIGYNHNEKRYIRITFKKLDARKKCHRLLNDNDIKTYSNNTSSYYRVVAREHLFNLSSWNIISNYKLESSGMYKSKYVIRININDIKEFNENEFDGINEDLIKYDRTIIGCFDIEMCPGRSGDFPSGKNPDDHLFMIGTTFHFTKQSRSLLNVIIVSKPCEPQEDIFTIVCSNERMVLRVFSTILKMIQPDFLTEFNGSGFDWQAIIDKLQYYNIMQLFLQDISISRLRTDAGTDKFAYYYKEWPIKITGGNNSVISKNIKVNGCIPFDTMIIFKVLEPTAESHSLNSCLKMCNLGSKDDMAISRMFHIYRYGNAAGMKEVAHYCFVDCKSLQEMLIQRNVVQDKREVAILSYTSIYDGFLYANGSKIRNLLMSIGFKKNLMFNTVAQKKRTDDEEKKYTGALVLNPIKGVVAPMMSLKEFLQFNEIEYSKDEYDEMIELIDTNYSKIFESKDIDSNQINNPHIQKYIEYVKKTENQYPVSGLDFSSLYPSIIMAYNLSPECMIFDRQYMEKVKAMGKNLHFINFKYDNRNVEAWSVRHDNIEENLGLLPQILIDLFNRRKQLKALMHPFEKEKDRMEKEVENYKELAEYHDIVFQFNYYNSKQKALKIFMNTFYGELGNNISCIYVLEVAGGITTMGRYNLLLAKKFVETQLKAKTYYGDSVTKDTPIIIKKNDNISIIQIQDLVNEYTVTNSNKEIHNLLTDVHILTERGWTLIKKVIRHKTDKAIYRVRTNCGLVDVTEDHSLLDSKANKIKPSECTKDTELLHWNNDLLKIINDGTYETDVIEYVYGAFLASGAFFVYVDTENDISNYHLSITNIEESELKKYSRIFNSRYQRVSLIPDYFTNHKVITNMSSSCLVNKWKSLFYTDRMELQVPDLIINGSYNQKRAFFEGYKSVRYPNKLSKIGAQGLILLATELSLDISLYVHNVRISAIDRETQHNKIKNVRKLSTISDYVYDLETESHHFAAGVGRLVLHNTDSLYISSHKDNYKELDYQYFTDKLDKETYATQLIKRTFELIEEYKTLVNIELAKDNGTKYLKMSYEEVLYPVAFLGKKKYYGIPHIGLVNFRPNKLFIRGLEVIKRGTSEVLKNICNDIMRTSVSIDNIKTIRQLISLGIARYFSTKWDMEYFIKTAVYKSYKNNVSVHRFISRMREINYPDLPEEGIRFSFIVAKVYPYTYDTKGRQTKLLVGDRWEFIERAKSLHMDVDLLYYFNNEITGQLARLLSYDPEFNTYIPTEYELQMLTEDEITKKQEEHIFKNCKKYILDISEQYAKPYSNKGKIYKDVYSKVKKSINIKSIYQNKRMNVLLDMIPQEVATSEHFLFSYIEHLKLKAANDPSVDTFASATIKKLKNDKIHVKHMKVMYSNHKSSLYSISTRKIQQEIDDQQKELEEYVNRYNLKDNLFNLYGKNIENIVMSIRDRLNFQQICNENIEVETLSDIISDDELAEIISDNSNYIEIDDDHISIIMDITTSLFSKFKSLAVLNRISDQINTLYNRFTRVVEEPKNYTYNTII